MADPRINVILGARDDASKVVTGLRGQFRDFGADAKAGFGLGAGISAFSFLKRGVGAVTDFMGDAVNAAADFEEGLGIINTVAKLSEDQLGELGSAIQSLAIKAGKPTEELTTAFYDLVSAGVDADDAMKVLEDSTTLATGALSTTGEAVDLITTTLNAWKMEAGESTRVMDVWAQTVTNGKVTASELAASMAQIAPIASATGVSIEEVGAAFATMTAQGTPAAKAATQMQAAITALLKPNARLTELQKELGGETFESMLRNRGLAAALQAVTDAADGNTAEITAALGSTEAYNAVLQLTGDSAKTFTGNLNDMRTAATEGGVAIGQLAERSDTYRFKQDRMNAAVEVLNQKIGAFVVGPAGDFLGWMADVVSGGPQASSALEGVAQQIGLLAEDAAAAASTTEIINDRLEAIPGFGRLFGVDFFPHETEFRAVVEDLTEVGSALGLTQDDLRLLAEEAKRTGVGFDVLKSRLVELHLATQRDFDVDISVDSSQLMTAHARAMALFGVLRNIGGSGALTEIRDDRPPGRAFGGPVSSGQTYLVGERGPELLHMGGNGYVTPNNKMGGHGHSIYLDGRLVGRAVDQRLGDRASLTRSGNDYRSAD